jgi:hypothetical protein
MSTVLSAIAAEAGPLHAGNEDEPRRLRVIGE